MSLEPLRTASGSDFPLCRQLSVFVENRLGQLLRLTRLFEKDELLVVEIPHGKRGIRSICEALIAGEINMNYIYPLFPDDKHEACVAIQVDDLPLAASVLSSKKFRLIDQSEL